uniref:Rhodanese domain-containing protein n=1 Tax=Steinernema glaseri TaxID=37863 RepID=A0A1I8AX44_9BILA
MFEVCAREANFISYAAQNESSLLAPVRTACNKKTMMSPRVVVDRPVHRGGTVSVCPRMTEQGMREIEPCRLADWIRQDRVVVVDCRSFMEYNSSHVRSAVNAFYSKMIRRRLQKQGGCCDFINKHLSQYERRNSDEKVDLVLYGSGRPCPPNKSSCSTDSSSSEAFLATLYEQIVNANAHRFRTVMVLKGKRCYYFHHFFVGGPPLVPLFLALWRSSKKSMGMGDGQADGAANESHPASSHLHDEDRRNLLLCEWLMVLLAELAARLRNARDPPGSRRGVRMPMRRSVRFGEVLLAPVNHSSALGR